MGGRSAPSHRDGASVPYRLGQVLVGHGLGGGGQRDHVGQLGHRLEVAQLGELGQADRVELVAGQEREVGIVGHDHPALAVVEQVALADGLDEQRVAGGIARRARARRRRVAVRGRRRRTGRPRRRGRARRQAPIGLDGGHEAGERVAHRTAPGTWANAAVAASTVRSTCSAVWAREGNHASNCEGGG